ncbi:AzlC family ABC transporter permease [Acinetobacter sp. CWB-B33]|uniref:AzlC family ABC transporter permease n=1 Tax=Acinetobacter sp. CWB-B33 TaxID=2815724 RepID=UPI001C571285|nr:AzlC family ABC transporter permease [Acinetobacter johnsonii]
MMKTWPYSAKGTPSLGFWQGVQDMLPLSIAVIPWGILAGSAAVNAGLSLMQAIGMSAFVFAGAAQLVSLSMLSAGASAVSIVLTIFFLTSQHFIYALHLRDEAVKLPLAKRLCLGFLLTDELYATAMLTDQRPYRYLLGAGLSFYLCWVGFSIAGIGLAAMVPDLSAFHLEFSIVVIFLVMAVLLLNNRLAIVGVCVSALSAAVFSWLKLEAAIVLAGLCGMLAAAWLDWRGSR